MCYATHQLAKRVGACESAPTSETLSGVRRRASQHVQSAAGLTPPTDRLLPHKRTYERYYVHAWMRECTEARARTHEHTLSHRMCVRSRSGINQAVRHKHTHAHIRNQGRKLAGKPNPPLKGKCWHLQTREVLWGI
jgi:hypothetical protein